MIGLILGVLATLGPLLVALLFWRHFPGMPRSWRVVAVLGVVLIGAALGLWGWLTADWVWSIGNGVFAVGLWLLVVSQAWAIKAWVFDRNGRHDAPDT